ncbi:MAG: LLM class flavin-dependent oxidoreductase [Deltaproteobacteria bacterium]
MNSLGLILDAHSLSELAHLAADAEDAGFHSLWATELYRTSFEQLSCAAHATKRIALGTAVALAFVRSPLITALSSLDLDEISGGRLILGLGTGAKRTNELFHGVPFGAKPATRIKECIRAIRLIAENAHTSSPVTLSGEYYNINTRGYRRPFKPYREKFPIYLAGVGAGMTRAAAEVADGYLGHVVCSAHYIKEVVVGGIRAGLQVSGRAREDFTVASIITCAVSENRKQAMDAARRTIAFYATVRPYEPPFRLHGFEKEAAKIREAYSKGDIQTMIDAVSDDMVSAFAVVGSRDECRRKIAAYREILDVPILSAPHYFLDFKEVKEYQRAILDTFGD